MTSYDAIVLGVGGMGSAALWHLAHRGARVLGIEQFRPGHDRGSSHGGSRLIRRAYFEHPDYVPLVSRAYQLWSELEAACGQRLFHRTGLFLAGQEHGSLITGVLRAAAAHRLDIKRLSASVAAARFPYLRLASDMAALYEADAGFLEVENCVRAMADQAAIAGAQLRTEEKVERWESDSGGVRVVTAQGQYVAKHLIVCGGAWSRRLLESQGRFLEVRRKVVAWYETPECAYRVDSGCPVFCFETHRGFFYGFPSFDGQTVKVGEHSGGQIVPDPDALDRAFRPSDRGPLDEFVQSFLSAATTKVRQHSVCMYTMTPDEHFVIDRHPDHENVWVACGFSGHGFKFASVVGSILADFVTTGGTREPAGFLQWSRIARR